VRRGASAALCPGAPAVTRTQIDFFGTCDGSRAPFPLELIGATPSNGTSGPRARWCIDVTPVKKPREIRVRAPNS